MVKSLALQSLTLTRSPYDTLNAFLMRQEAEMQSGKCHHAIDSSAVFKRQIDARFEALISHALLSG